jgi:hypothetical protein
MITPCTTGTIKQDKLTKNAGQSYFDTTQMLVHLHIIIAYPPGTEGKYLAEISNDILNDNVRA